LSRNGEEKEISSSPMVSFHSIYQLLWWAVELGKATELVKRRLASKKTASSCSGEPYTQKSVDISRLEWALQFSIPGVSAKRALAQDYYIILKMGQAEVSF
jgi:hypothetical protein